MNANVSLQVRQTIVEILRDRGCTLASLESDTSLPALGLDSLRMVDLAVALEEELGLAEFPIQDWADTEAGREPPRFTVGSLIQACMDLIEPSQEDNDEQGFASLV